MGREWRSDHRDGGDLANRADLVIAELAERQDGVVERRQLLDRGVTKREIDRRLRSRRLIALLPGVYAVGHLHLRPEGRRRAVLLACGPQAALSHRSSLDGLGLLTDARAVWDVTVPPSQARGRSSSTIRLHRAVLRRDQVVELDGLRMTGPARTLVDVAAVERPRLVSRAVDAALREQRYDQRSIDAEIRTGRRGASRLRRVLEERHPDAHLTRSELEARALESLRRYHAHRRRADAERDERLRAAGLEVRRYGWGDVASGWMAADVAARLAS